MTELNQPRQVSLLTPRSGLPPLETERLDGDQDNFLQNESCFFYWKSSFSLWRDKLADYDKFRPLIIPVHWAFHTLSADLYDFGRVRPEANLRVLIEMAQEMGFKVLLAIFMTPAPLFTNGGVPVPLARYVAHSRQGMVYAIADAQGGVNRFYSFFDPKVYNAFLQFVTELARELKPTLTSLEVISLEAGYTEGEAFSSYFHDSSLAFQQNFSNYVTALKREHGERGNFDASWSEQNLKIKYHEHIRALYIDAIQSSWGEIYSGHLQWSFLGGGPDEIFVRAKNEFEHDSLYAKDFFSSLTLNVIPSALLLPKEVKRQNLSKLTSQIFNFDYFNQRIPAWELGSDDTGYRPLNFFEIVLGQWDLLHGETVWQRTALLDVLKKFYPYTYRISSQLASGERLGDRTDKIFFVQGRQLELADIPEIINILMHGMKVVLDCDQIRIEVEQKLNSFFFENNLPVQNYSYLGELKIVRLGEGGMVLLSGKELEREPLVKKFYFWENLIQYFNIAHITVDLAAQTYLYWQRRDIFTNEIGLDEIRRAHLFNPTSYKCYVRFDLSSKVQFIKSVDEINSKIVHAENQVKVEILPGGSLIVDWGMKDVQA